MTKRYTNYESIIVVNEPPELPQGMDMSPRKRLSLVVVALIIIGLVCLVAGSGAWWTAAGSSSSRSEMQHQLPTFGSSRNKKVLAILEELDKNIEGSVIFMHDDAFCNAADVWKQGLKPPLAVVEAANEADVQVAVPVLADIFIQWGVSFRVRSGGHSYGGYSTVEKGIILSLSGLKELAFDQDTGIASMGSAVKVQDLLDQVLVPYEYGGVIGECPGVAEGGFVLGGGIGFLSRKYGMGSDSLLSARVVLRDGNVVIASETESPDLFWALRGAGQNMFGVVTHMEYQLHPSQNTQLFVTGEFPLDPAILATVGKMYGNAPGEYFFLLEGTLSRHGTTDALISWFDQNDAGLDTGEAYIKENVATLLPANSSDNLSFDRLSWSEVTRAGGNFDGNLVRAWTGFLFEENNTEEVWEDIVDKLKSVCAGNPYMLLDIELWGGAIVNKQPYDTAFFYRNAVYNVGIILLIPADLKHADKIFKKTVKDVDKAWRHVEKHLEGVYTNYIMESLTQKESSKAYWGDNLSRLQQLKQRYDPENTFHHPQSVAP